MDKYALALMASAGDRLARQREERLVWPIAKEMACIGQSEAFERGGTSEAHL
jgi:hypothetical protein